MKLKFRLNKDLDKFMTLQFLDERAAGVDFGKNIIKTHPKLKEAKNTINNSKLRKKIVNDYFDKYYLKNKNVLNKKMALFKREWLKKEDKFFEISERFFGGFKFKKGMYICYLSIIDCNPRFLESKTFQLFYRKKLDDAIHTIAHELLHFIFFDFVKDELSKEINHLSEDKLWDLSEIFNVIVLKSEPFNKIIKKGVVHCYPKHKKYLSRFGKIYKKSKNAEEFIRSGVKILEK